jgi:hypothetical protein
VVVGKVQLVNADGGGSLKSLVSSL